MGDDTYMGVPIITSPYMPDGQMMIVDKMVGNLKAATGISDAMRSIAGMSADFAVMDEWTDIESAYLNAVANGNSGILQRAALKEMERREREQAELEAVPGFGSF